MMHRYVVTRVEHYDNLRELLDRGYAPKCSCGWFDTAIFGTPTRAYAAWIDLHATQVADWEEIKAEGREAKQRAQRIVERFVDGYSLDEGQSVRS